MLRDILISSLSSGKRRRPLPITGFAKTRVTEQFLAGLEFLPPLKIKSAEFWARITRLDFGPRTNWMASPQLDFPEPLGPVMAVKPRSRGTVTSPLNDLKFNTSSDFRYIPIPQRWNKSPPRSEHPFFTGFKQSEEPRLSAPVFNSGLQPPRRPQKTP